MSIEYRVLLGQNGALRKNDHPVGGRWW